MNIIFQLEKGISEIEDDRVTLEDTGIVIGKVISYDKSSGKTIVSFTGKGEEIMLENGVIKDPYNLLGKKAIFTPNSLGYRDIYLKLHSGIPDGVEFEIVRFEKGTLYWLQSPDGLRIRITQEYIRDYLIKL